MTTTREKVLKRFRDFTLGQVRDERDTAYRARVTERTQTSPLGGTYGPGISNEFLSALDELVKIKEGEQE